MFKPGLYLAFTVTVLTCVGFVGWLFGGRFSPMFMQVRLYVRFSMTTRLFAQAGVPSALADEKGVMGSRRSINTTLSL